MIQQNNEYIQSSATLVTGGLAYVEVRSYQAKQ